MLSDCRNSVGLSEGSEVSELSDYLSELSDSIYIRLHEERPSCRLCGRAPKQRFQISWAFPVEDGGLNRLVEKFMKNERR